jgi:hypothetical protein
MGLMLVVGLMHGASAADVAKLQVERVVVVTESGSGVGGMPIYVYTPYLLLRGGVAIRRPQSALDQIDIQSLRSSSPNSVGGWQAEGSELVLSFPGMRQPRRVKRNAFYVAIPAKAGEGLSGEYRTVGGGGNSALGGGLSIISSRSFRFFSDGRFERVNLAGASASGDPRIAGRSGSADTGRYRLDGHTISLIDTSGRTQRAFFAFGANPDGTKTTEVIYINAVSYLRK